MSLVSHLSGWHLTSCRICLVLCVLMLYTISSNFPQPQTGNYSIRMFVACVCAYTDLQLLHTSMSSPKAQGPWSKCLSVWRTRCSPDSVGPPAPLEPCNVLCPPAVQRYQEGLTHKCAHMLIKAHTPVASDVLSARHKITGITTSHSHSGTPFRH